MEIKVVKTTSKKTFKAKDGKERHYENYSIVATMENGAKIRIPFTPNYDFDKDVFKNLKLITSNE